MTVKVVSVSTAYRNGYNSIPTLFATKKSAMENAERLAHRQNADAVVCRITDSSKEKKGYRIFLKHPRPIRGYSKSANRTLSRTFRHTRR